MRDKSYLKVSVPIAIAEALLELPEYKNNTITRVISDLADTKLSNTNSKENREKKHEPSIN
ncbi:hypothetical protein AB4538_06590 [Vibrio lentus]